MTVSNKLVFPVFKLSIPDEINRVILEESGFSGICTDHTLIVIQSFGNTSAYLKNEIFNFNLNELLPDQIALTVKAAAHKALTLHEKVMLNGLDFGNSTLVNLIIKPILIEKPARTLLLILFSVYNGKLKKDIISTPASLRVLTKEHVLALELELENARKDLELAHEGIASSNENMQSFNEELLSANEEMQSANEELQSVNEESQTINKEQQITNAELMELNDDLNNYFRSNINGQLFVDKQLLLKKYSPAAVKLINLRESDLGRPLNNITTNIKFETLIEDIQNVILNGQTITREAESSDGRVYQVMTMPYISRDQKDAKGAVISFYDITELKTLLNDLDISNRKLQKSIKALEDGKEQVSQSLAKERELSNLKSRFVSMASHEFRTPLTTIQLSAVLIEKYAANYSNENISKHINKIKMMLGNLNGILGDFLSLERLEAGKVETLLSEIDIVKFSEAITEEMQMIAKQNQRIIYQHTGKGSLVHLDQALLKNCVINLISNAIKYSGADTFIEFNTEVTDKKLTLVVKDNGIGIPENDQQHLFEAFFRAHNTGNIPGTGLGLNIVTRYTSLMKGKISFESKVNQGTSFTIELPLSLV
jgi:two-component system CheB/CheR fusion protein